MNVGDRVTILYRSCDAYGKDGEIVAVAPNGFITVRVDGVLRYNFVESDLRLLASAVPASSALGKPPVIRCGLPGCQKENDISARACWNCGSSFGRRS